MEFYGKFATNWFNKNEKRAEKFEKYIFSKNVYFVANKRKKCFIINWFWENESADNWLPWMIVIERKVNKCSLDVNEFSVEMIEF